MLGCTVTKNNEVKDLNSLLHSLLMINMDAPSCSPEACFKDKGEETTDNPNSKTNARHYQHDTLKALRMPGITDTRGHHNEGIFTTLTKFNFLVSYW